MFGIIDKPKLNIKHVKWVRIGEKISFKLFLKNNDILEFEVSLRDKKIVRYEGRPEYFSILKEKLDEILEKFGS